MQICVRALVFVVVMFVSAHPAWAANGFLIVGNQPANCPDTQFTTIQAALNAATPGQRIHLCRGTYPEQLKITKPVHIDSDNGVVLLPTDMQANTTSLVSGAPIAAAILVIDTTNVIIEGMIVDGINNNVSACAPQLIGIEYQNASGVVENVTVRNFKLTAALNGCQSGTALFAQSGGGGVSDVEVHDTVLYDYQKNGITANEAGTAVMIHDNVVTGAGPTTGAAQNGIQVGFGAKGVIRGNTVSNNIWSPCVAVDTCTNVGTGILVEESDSVQILGNNVGLTQIGIFINGNDANVRQNQVAAVNVFDGIRVEGNGNRLEKNDVFTLNNAYTTCDLADPHFRIISKKAKAITGDKIISGPFYMEFNHVPTPLGFAFGIFPSQKQGQSGIIVPAYGEEQTRGLGAGADPELGHRSAFEEQDKIKELLKGSDMVFLASGSGGGTGTGAAPVVAKLARDIGALTVAAVTKPFAFEGARRAAQAEEGIAALGKEVDTMIVVPNERLMAVVGKQIPFTDALKKADEVLLHATQGIADLITHTGMINVDFADVRTIMQNGGAALMGTGTGKGENRSMEAAQQAISSPLLDNVSIQGATGVLINITHGPDLTMDELTRINDIIHDAAGGEAEIIFGNRVDEAMQGEVRVTVIATGFDRQVSGEPGMRSMGGSATVLPFPPAKKMPAPPPAPQATTPAPKTEPKKGSSTSDEMDIPTFIRRQMD